ncbi:MAG: hypothetical protein M1822_006944 [Bathelium mastoideum]|nr:MAG: hypothetical protein M1822_006944 [Bathelium mastoideum]
MGSVGSFEVRDGGGIAGKLADQVSDLGETKLEVGEHCLYRWAGRAHWVVVNAWVPRYSGRGGIASGPPPSRQALVDQCPQAGFGLACFPLNLAARTFLPPSEKICPHDFLLCKDDLIKAAPIKVGSGPVLNVIRSRSLLPTPPPSCPAPTAF